MRAALLAAAAVLGAPRAAAQTGGSSSCIAQPELSEHLSDLGLIAEDDHAVQTVVNTISVGGVAGYTTYQISLLMAPEVQNIYAIYGDGPPGAAPLEFPPAYQVATPFGVNVGGANPSFFSYSPTANFDSWLTIGLTAGDTDNAVSSIGISFDAWSEQNALVSASGGGSVFWMNPDAVRVSPLSSVTFPLLSQLCAEAGAADGLAGDTGGQLPRRHEVDGRCATDVAEPRAVGRLPVWRPGPQHGTHVRVGPLEREQRR